VQNEGKSTKQESSASSPEQAPCDSGWAPQTFSLTPLLLHSQLHQAPTTFFFCFSFLSDDAIFFAVVFCYQQVNGWTLGLAALSSASGMY